MVPFEDRKYGSETTVNTFDREIIESLDHMKRFEKMVELSLKTILVSPFGIFV